MIPVVYAMGTEMVEAPHGPRVRVVKGTHWPAEDPVVRARPDLFSPDPRFGMLYTVEPAGYDAPVEEATANPGEQRSVRRRAS